MQTAVRAVSGGNEGKRDGGHGQVHAVQTRANQRRRRCQVHRLPQGQVRRAVAK